MGITFDFLPGIRSLSDFAQDYVRVLYMQYRVRYRSIDLDEGTT